MNVKLLRKVAKHILAEPKRYNQNTCINFGRPGQDGTDDFRNPLTYPPCGTVGCIAGWADILTYPKLRRFSYERARKACGLTRDQAVKLFSYVNEYNPNWPKAFADCYRSARTPRLRAKIAANRIEHFIKTGE